MPRMTVSQVWRCESMKPGMTMQPDASIVLRVAGVEVVADGRDALALDQHVAAVDVADLRIHAQDVPAAEQNSLRHAASLRCAVCGV